MRPPQADVRSGRGRFGWKRAFCVVRSARARPPRDRSPDEALHDPPFNRHGRRRRRRRRGQGRVQRVHGLPIEQDPRPPSTRAPRGRRRPDPFEGVFDEDVVPMLEAWAATVAEPASAVEELADTVEDAARGWDLGRARDRRPRLGGAPAPARPRPDGGGGRAARGGGRGAPRRAGPGRGQSGGVSAPAPSLHPPDGALTGRGTNATPAEAVPGVASGDVEPGFGRTSVDATSPSHAAPPAHTPSSRRQIAWTDAPRSSVPARPRRARSRRSPGALRTGAVGWR